MWGEAIMQVEIREYENMQRKDLILSFLEYFYAQSDNIEKLILVFDGTVYWTILAYDELRSFSTERTAVVFKCRLSS